MLGKRSKWGRSDLNTQPLGISNHAPELSHPPFYRVSIPEAISGAQRHA